jgi:hypothetical protein
MACMMLQQENGIVKIDVEDASFKGNAEKNILFALQYLFFPFGI